MRKMPQCFSSNALSVFAAISVIIVDQLSKFVVLSLLDEEYCVAPFFNLVLVMNRGVTFGFLGSIVSPALLVVFACAIIFALLMFVRSRPSYYHLPVAVIIGGAIGNIIDRLIHGAVVDFLDFHLCNYHWPAFNIADTSVVVGVLTLFYISYIEEMKK